MRETVWVGRIQGREVEVAPVAWCATCGANRLLQNPKRWPGWPDSETPVTGECVSCGSTVSVHARKPGSAA